MAKLEQGNLCPLLKKDCVGLQCSWYMQVRGINPQTGTEIDDWGCSVVWMPLMLIENSNMQRQTGAAVESFRNEMVKANESSNQVLLAAAGVTNMKMIGNE